MIILLEVFSFIELNSILFFILIAVSSFATIIRFGYHTLRSDVEGIRTHTGEVGIDSSFQNFNHGDNSNQRCDADCNDGNGEIRSQFIVANRPS